MKICVCGDSHGNRDGIKRMLELERPDTLLFTGDGIRDTKGLTLPERTLFVKGNNDFLCDEPELRDFTLDGVRIIMAHGHKFAVKYGTDPYLNEALSRDARVAVFGHTHFQTASWQGGVLLLNPGPMSLHCNYYALLFIENAQADCQLKRLMDI